MDIGGLMGGVSSLNQTTLQNAQAEKLQSSIKNDYNGASDEELMDACKQFEAYFVEQMYKAMIKTIPNHEQESGSNATMLDYYKDQMVQKMATETTDKENLGLAQMLYEQMKRNYGTNE